MRTRNALLLVLGLAGIAAVGCTPPPPHVYRHSEFDRRQPTFGREPKDIATVIVCYGSWKTPPESVTAVAEAECGKYGKVAVLKRQDYQLCPLTTPVAAYFSCGPAGGAVARPAVSPVPADGLAAPAWAAPPLGPILDREPVE